MDLKCEIENEIEDNKHKNENQIHSYIIEKEKITKNTQSEWSGNKFQDTIDENKNNKINSSEQELENYKESSNIDNTSENKHNIIEYSDNTQTNCIQHPNDILDSIQNDYPSNEEAQINQNNKEVNTSEIEKGDKFEDESFFSNFSDFQKAEEKNVQKKNTLIDIYNEMKNYEEDFLSAFEKLYKKNIENISFMEKEKENKAESDIDLISIDSISAFLNDENVHNFNPIPLEHYISQNINYFVQEQTRLNKKIKLNKSYFNNKNYYNTFPSNPKQRIFKEYKKTIWK
ncbi:conserved Plasmodium protein, unknown function [Plasmodium berghei]|uniref:Uncharacterized protein n=2 Tax=Plasmodium berghei TaxID=5821 RepID=A0A509AHR9_PLABA|nr:conserved Plasmodium protein, unknown function [Plasmodium berghei ANKA]CXI02538.1 conserved Plasmodium protein, unknown function [Plasmodium berghei]SCL91972.1 conserved Plasmodium protein, unknown function [Plasmodium berghei]SCM15567.1 conserved Plasmodium protein, unknown function [Plasmodium berghei]SCM17359.1 conserved Plasmodium protein, unknown function [Plasmodium berghei]SCN22598.1 conserved Plasmodium protein, unknown function [Plasmodium berghei]|eukprot:XP_034420165.1 conserved Plasmodium protein, unknown function [Plasmodium berghei ANKA]